ncbi:MAG: GSU2203 family decaheme c-type cytochrome [Bryobacterales bacterium]|nr:GSU2203 family decaheme c-type cytochrome [Bryobacterales bacterium]
MNFRVCLISLALFLFPTLILAAPQEAAPVKAQVAAAASTLPTGPATYVGSASCTGCHRRITEQFGFTVHARIKGFETVGDGEYCESCHGPGSQHVSSRGKKAFIKGFEGEAAIDNSRSCVQCHREGKASEWRGSIHMMGGLSCSDCHTIHQARPTTTITSNQFIGGASRNPEKLMIPGKTAAPPRHASLTKREPELCLDCHKDIRAEINFSSHHPIIEGRMTCSSCHDVHGGQMSMLASNERSNDMCYSCHPSLQGPFVFEHAAVEEGCASCHNPHGSVVNNMLRQNEPFLCLQCHESHFHVGRDGISTAVNLPTGGSTNPFGSAGFRKGFGTKCTNCHTMVHGTDLPSQSMPSQGKGLTR